MATAKQVRAAKRNIQKAQRSAKSKRTIATLPEATRRAVEQVALGLLTPAAWENNSGQFQGDR